MSLLLSSMKSLVGLDTRNAEFEEFVRLAEPRLARALIAIRGFDDGNDAVGEALAWAWEHWDRLQLMDNPVGYLYRVGQSRSRPKRHPNLPPVAAAYDREIDPGLPAALGALSPKQRGAVWLVHGCGWSYREAAEALGISVSAVGTHATRALRNLRNALEEHDV